MNRISLERVLAVDEVGDLAHPLPIFYGGLEPLSSSVHGNYRSRTSDRAPFLTRNHAVPITIDEFVAVQRHFPIVFSIGENPVPLALMGLNENVNVFVDEEEASSAPEGEPERKPRVEPKPRPFPLPGATMQPPEPEGAERGARGRTKALHRRAVRRA